MALTARGRRETFLINTKRGGPGAAKLVLSTESESYRHKSIKGQHPVGHSGGRGCYWMVHSTDLWTG